MFSLHMCHTNIFGTDMEDDRSISKRNGKLNQPTKDIITKGGYEFMLYPH